MDKFTKLNINGEERYVSSIYDGSGNNIEETYETIVNSNNKKSELSGMITTANEALNALTQRVVATEAFDSRITTNTSDIKTNTTAITELKQVDASFREELDALTIKVGTNSKSLETLDDDLSTINRTVSRNSNSIEDINAIINDEAQGINALNTQADTNTAEIAKVSQELTTLKTSVVSLETFNSLVVRVEALEKALAENHPTTPAE